MSENSTLPDKGLARRSIVRAGVTAAWAVPAITVVAAAPAFATCPTTNGTTTGTATRSGKVVTFTATTSATTLTVTNIDANGNNTLQTITATSGWSSAGSTSGKGRKQLVSSGTASSGCSVIFTVNLHNNDPRQGLRFTFTTSTGDVAYTQAFTL
ncbi:MAG: hypothetical protein ACR2K3_07600 [Nocardioides sp.]